MTDAFVCTYETRSVPGDGMWLFQVVRRVTDGLDELLVVYSTPDDSSQASGGCTADLPNPLIVFLHSDQPTHAVRAPWTPCHKPTPQAQQAFQALTTAEIWTRKDRRVQSEQSITTHCSDSYKDVLEMYSEGSSRPAQRSSTPVPLEGDLSVCRYTVVKDAQGDRIGQLDSAVQVDPSAFNEAFAQSTPDDTCSTTEHTRFALVTSSKGSVVVALDGCAVYEDSAGYFRGSDALRALLK